MKISPLKNKNVLLTVGPTREFLDPVRYLSNASSGKMGVALAETLTQMGARVTAVSGPLEQTLPSSIKTISVLSALEMHRAVQKELLKTDAFIACAAVSDWRFPRVSPRKKKKKNTPFLTITLVKNPDILGAAGVWKKKTNAETLLIGFALETNDREKNARKKMKQKNLDLIVANTPQTFGSESIKAVWYDRDGNVVAHPVLSKKQMARRLGLWLHHQWTTSR